MPSGNLMKGFKYLRFIGLFAYAIQVDAQTLSSTYSDNGIGILHFQGLPRNMAMGEVGLAAPAIWNVNLLNPAFLPMNRFSAFQAGVEVDRRNVRNELLSSIKVSGGIRFLNYAFPVVNGKWGSSFGLIPYSSSNTRKFTEATLSDNTTTITTFQNSGGLSALHWSNGVQLAKNFYAGLKMTYLFGSIEHIERLSLDNLNTFETEYSDESNFSGLKYDLYLGYIHELADKKSLNFGIQYGADKELEGPRNIAFQTPLTNRQDIESNTVEQFNLPSSLGIGISYRLINKLTIGIDYVTKNWSKGGGISDEFIDTHKVGFGLEWIPEYSSINNYWKRISYRTGFTTENLPYVVNGKQINEIGITFGTSFPIGVSSVDFAFKYGTLGTTEGDLSRETYFRAVLGVTMNSRWFVKRRYD